MLDLRLSQAAKVREKLLVTHQHIKEPLDNVLRFMERYHYVQSNRLYRPGIEIDRNALNEQLAWFGSREADTVLKSVAGEVAFANDAEDDQQRPDPARVFRFANLLRQGFGYTACENNLVWFLAWENRLVDELEPGTILLDATADSDGVKIVPWMTPMETPQATLQQSGDCPCPEADQTEPQSSWPPRLACGRIDGWSRPSRRHSARSEGIGVCHKQLIAQSTSPTGRAAMRAFDSQEVRHQVRLATRRAAHLRAVGERDG